MPRKLLLIGLSFTIVVAACAAPTPAPQQVGVEPAAVAPAEEPAQLAGGVLFAVVSDSMTELYTYDGARVAAVDTAGPANVQYGADALLIADRQQARLFGPDGRQRGQGVTIAPGSGAALGNDRMVVTYDDYAAFFDSAAQSRGNFNTPVSTFPSFVAGFVVLSGEGWTGVFRADGALVINATTAGQGEVLTVADGLVLVDNAMVRFYASDGQPRGMAVDTGGQAKVAVVGDRVVVSHPGWTDIYTAGGSFRARIATDGAATPADLDGRICLRDASMIRLLDADGAVLTQNLPQPADAEVLEAGDRILVVHDDWIGVYDATGQSSVNIATAGRARTALAGDRLIVADGETIRIFSADGVQVAGAIRLPNAEIRVVGDRLVAAVDGQLSTFDLNGAPLGTVPTTGPPQLTAVANGLLLVDTRGVQLLSPEGGPAVPLASLDRSATVVVKEVASP